MYIKPKDDDSAAGCNFPFKGGKKALTEGGVRIPLIVASTKRKLKSQ